MTTLNGWLVIDKPEGMTSAQVVGKVKRLLKPSKIGHAGTLDPFATGVLPLALGEATKTAGYGLDKDKSYEFTLQFGEARDTEDCTGNITETSDKRPTQAEIEAILPWFMGEISQVPPIYSAIHINGQRAYALARAGEVVEMEPRQVVIHRLEFLGWEPDSARFSVVCSKGTYIRSLARDMAIKLGTVGHVSVLRRVKSGVFTLADAISLENLEESVSKGALLGLLQPTHAVLDDILVLQVTGQEATNLRHGKALLIKHPVISDSLMQARFGDELIAIGRIEEKTFKPQRVFNQ